MRIVCLRGRWRSLDAVYECGQEAVQGRAVEIICFGGFLQLQCYDWINECIHLAWPLNPRLCLCLYYEWKILRILVIRFFLIESSIFGCKRSWSFKEFLGCVILQYCYPCGKLFPKWKITTYHVLVLALWSRFCLFIKMILNVARKTLNWFSESLVSFLSYLFASQLIYKTYWSQLMC